MRNPVDLCVLIQSSRFYLFICDLVLEATAVFSSKGPLTGGTDAGQASRKCVAQANSLPTALGMSAALGTGEYAVEMLFSL